MTAAKGTRGLGRIVIRDPRNSLRVVRRLCRTLAVGGPLETCDAPAVAATLAGGGGILFAVLVGA